MTYKNWKWSFGAAFQVIAKTYCDDCGRDKKQRQQLIELSQYITQVNVGAVTALKAGNGARNVLFVHGSPGNAMRWEHYLKNVPDDCTFYSIDRMGFGARKDQKPDLDKDYQLISQFARGLNNPIIVGHSLGGATAARLSADLDQVQSLILVAASLDPSLERIVPFQRIGLSPFISWLLTSSIRHSNQEMFQLSDFLIKTQSNIKNIVCPVHVFHAQDDGLVPFETIEFIKREFTNAKSVNIVSPERGGHAIPWTQSDVVFDFIREVKYDE